MAERFTRNEQVVSSILTISSNKKRVSLWLTLFLLEPSADGLIRGRCPLDARGDPDGPPAHTPSLRRGCLLLPRFSTGYYLCRSRLRTGLSVGVAHSTRRGTLTVPPHTPPPSEGTVCFFTVFRRVTIFVEAVCGRATIFAETVIYPYSTVSISIWRHCIPSAS